MVRRRREAEPACDEVAVVSHGTSPLATARLACNNPTSLGFARGNILALRMHNLMTFRDVELLPGPRLNMIIGPNGAGKSTVVSGICLAFAGNLALLGRSPNLGSFVRTGEAEAYVEVVVCNGRDGVRTVRRDITDDGKSAYTLDGARAKKGEVERIRKAFDIQLDNLTQFLPQERIAQFTELTPEMLLRSTMSALGGEGRLADYDGLMKDYDNLRAAETRGGADRKSLDELKAKNNAIDMEVQCFRRREEILQKIKVMEMLLPWLVYEQLLAEYDQLNADCKQAELQVREAKATYKAALQPVKEKEREIASQKVHVDKARKSAAKNDRRLEEALNKIEETTHQLADARGDHENVERTMLDRQKKIEKARAELERLRDKHAELP